MTRALLPACLLAALAGCAWRGHPQAAAAPHYLVGTPYQAGGVWRYPREQFDLDQTGLASRTTRIKGLTADGERADPAAMAAAHPTLQLPAVVQVTNLDNGLQVLVRVNDRGPAQPGRVIALTPRAIQLLGGGSAAALRVRVTVLPAESLRLAAELGGAEAPHLVLAVVPAGEVRQEPLPAPGAAPHAGLPAAAPVSARAAAPEPPPVPLRLPETVTQVPPRPGTLYVEVARFARLEYANLLQMRIRSLGAEVATDYDAPRDRPYRVRIGPLPDVASADAVLARTIASGMTDARIVAE